MEHASVHDFSRLIGRLYETTLDESLWPQIVEELRLLFNGSSSCLVRMGPNLNPDDVVSTAADVTYANKYITEFGDHHELAYAVKAIPLQQVYKDHELFGRNMLRRTRFWNEWMEPQDMYGGLACKLATRNSSSWVLDVQRGRSQPEFGDTETRMMNTLVPHFLRVREISGQLRVARLIETSFSQLSTGVLIVNARMEIIEANQLAEMILVSNSGLSRTRAGKLAGRTSQSTADLFQRITSVCQDGSLSHSQTESTSWMNLDAVSPYQDALAISLRPLRLSQRNSFSIEPLAVLFVRQIAETTSIFNERMKLLFGLTPKETQIVSELCSGKSLKEAAESGGIAFSTARSYLENIFYKTETCSQVQLVSLVGGSRI